MTDPVWYECRGKGSGLAMVGLHLMNLDEWRTLCGVHISAAFAAEGHRRNGPMCRACMATKRKTAPTPAKEPAPR